MGKTYPNGLSFHIERFVRFRHAIWERIEHENAEGYHSVYDDVMARAYTYCYIKWYKLQNSRSKQMEMEMEMAMCRCVDYAYASETQYM